MAFLTDRKRVTGLGAAHTGTAHHWSMTVSSYGLLVLIPLFLLSVGPVIGADYLTVVAHFGHPYPAIITALTLIVSLTHFKNGVRVLIEDYVHGMMHEILIIATVCFSYAAIAVGLFAIARMAL
jgi:succinate dehydrogenase / fumarate reductase membrane anchor subunit